MWWHKPAVSAETEAGGSGVHGHPQLLREFKANLGYLKPVSKQRGSVRWLSRGKVPGAKADNLSSVSRTHVWENRLLKVSSELSQPQHMHTLIK